MRISSNKIAKKNDNKGITLVELIVTIAIISVLTGVIVPQLMRYVTSNREKACIQNRDAVLHVFEKAVYAGDYVLDYDDNNLSVLMANLKGDEYGQQASEYLKCPVDGAAYTGYISTDESKAYIVCSEHDEVCVVDFTGWTGSGYEADDDKYDAKPHNPDRELPPTEEPDTPSGNKRPPSGGSGVWPYVTNPDGTIDSRWLNATWGAKSGSTIYIPVPKYAHFIADRSGSEYVIVKTDAKKGSQSLFKIIYEKSTSPEAMDVNDWSFVVKASGAEYSVDISKKNTDDMPVIGESFPDNQFMDNKYYFAPGDILNITYANGKKQTYIKIGTQNEAVSVPSDQYADQEWGETNGKWAVVPPLCDHWDDADNVWLNVEPDK